LTPAKPRLRRLRPRPRRLCEHHQPEEPDRLSQRLLHQQVRAVRQLHAPRPVQRQRDAAAGAHAEQPTIPPLVNPTPTPTVACNSGGANMIYMYGAADFSSLWQAAQPLLCIEPLPTAPSSRTPRRAPSHAHHMGLPCMTFPMAAYSNAAARFRCRIVMLERSAAARKAARMTAFRMWPPLIA
jgi:hypothetical protein